MNARTYTITDTITGAVATGDTSDLIDTVSTWYPEAPQEVIDGIGDLLVALRQGEYTGELESFLGLHVERLPE